MNYKRKEKRKNTYRIIRVILDAKHGHGIREGRCIASIVAPLERPAGRDAQFFDFVVERPRWYSVFPSGLQSTHARSDGLDGAQDVISRVLLVPFPFRLLLGHVGGNATSAAAAASHVVLRRRRRYRFL